MEDNKLPLSHYLHSSYNKPILRAWQSKMPRITDLVYPIFISDSPDELAPMKALPGQTRYGYKKVCEELKPLVKKGLKSILIFGILSDDKQKDQCGTYGGGKNKDGPVHLALKELKANLPDLFVICDVCLCGYTSHGHCGILNNDGTLDNEASLIRMAEMSVSYVEAGADMVAPSDMMDGRVAYIKKAFLQRKWEIGVMAYSAKFASSFYGPFRDVFKSAPQKGDRKGYQLPSDSKELALRAVQRDLEEGADFVMVKPITAYLDIVSDMKKKFDCTIAAYHVSGEYAMLYYAAQNNSIDLKLGVMEYMRSFKRAGVDIILTYFTPQLLDWIPETEF